MELVKDIDYSISFNEAVGGTMSSLSQTAKLGSTVTVTACPAPSFLLKDISVKDEKGRDVSFDRGWLSDNTVTFVMPGENVTVTPSFTKGWSAGG